MTDSFGKSLAENVGRVMLGKPQAVELAVTTLIAGGHLLIEDRPGVGKTLLARAIARSLELPWRRLQCTADLLPADVLGSQVWSPQTGELRFHPGPVFTSVLIADELNRTPPRTQSALLECMAERSVTVDGEPLPLPDPFFVVTTQNPYTSAGTYPLPESQLDRFLMRIGIGYPTAEDELRVAVQRDGHRALAELGPIASVERVSAARRAVHGVRVQEDVLRYLVELCRRTRELPDASLGVSPRGTQALHLAVRARAVLHDRDYVVPDDIHRLAVPVLAHRIQTDGGTESAEALIAELVARVPAPE